MASGARWPVLLGLLVLLACMTPAVFGFSRVSSSSKLAVPSWKRQQRLFANIYDDWRSDAVADTMFLCEENVLECLEEL
eukprot:scaffold65999_cov28-Attheya_sp.AAC.1